MLYNTLRKIRQALRRRDEDYRGVSLYPPGHFYSPLITLTQFCANEPGCLDSAGTLWRHVDLCPDVQSQTLEQIGRNPPPEFPETKTEGWRYYAKNDYYGYGSAAILAGMMQIYRPKRVVEVGSGFSSAAMLDTAECNGWDTRFTFIEPDPNRLKSLLRREDVDRVRIIEQPVQRVGLEVFQELERSDLLFIDSSHVIKPGSDLADLFFRVMPALKKGCLVHFHDIFYPEIYPREWMLKGISWNETFLLRAFLLFNESFKVVLFNQYAQKEFREALAAWSPRVADGEMSSIWIQRVA